MNPRDLCLVNPAIKPGRIYRSDQTGIMHWIRNPESSTVKTIIDLRHQFEISSYDYKPFLPGDIVHVNSPLDLEFAKLIYPGTPMESVYQFFSIDCQSFFAGVLRLLLISPIPIVIHCRHGIDRTGVTTALLLLLLETPIEKILQDYMVNTEIAVRKHLEIFLNHLSGFNTIEDFIISESFSTHDMIRLKSKFLKP